MRVLGLVVARCHSKGFVDKNIARIGDNSLLELAVKVGLGTSVIDDVYISTDCEKYETMAIQAGAKSVGLRPEHLAQDSSKTIDAVLDLLDKLQNKYDFLVLFQPTSPIRKPQDIENMLKELQRSEADACISVSKIDEPHPNKLKVITKEGLLKPFIEGADSELPRQELSSIFALNGAIYLSKVKSIIKEKTLLPKKTIPYIMKDFVNIDNELDFLYLKTLIEHDKVELYQQTGALT